MRDQILKKVIQAVVSVAAVSIAISAQAVCKYHNDSWNDNHDLAEFVKSEVTGFKKVSLNNQVEGRVLKINRNDENYPVFQALNNMGIVTATPQFDVQKFKTGEDGYAQVIPLTKCHWITNLHVAQGLANKKKEDLKLGLEAFGSFGQGKSCEGTNSFRVSGIPAKLVAFNDEAFLKNPKASVQTPNTMKVADGKDWAMFQSSRALTEVKPAKLSKDDFSFGRPAILVGNSVSDIIQNDFSVLNAQVVRAASFGGGGLMIMNEKENKPGRSGGGVFLIDEEQGLVLSAIYVGEGNVLNLSAIFAQMKIRHPEVVKDIVRVLKGGECQ